MSDRERLCREAFEKEEREAGYDDASFEFEGGEYTDERVQFDFDFFRLGWEAALTKVATGELKP